MTVLATITVCMRFYTRRLILSILGPEDWLILISMVYILLSRQPFLGHQATANSLFTGPCPWDMCGLRPT
jgi:hypothetical protein